MTTKSNLQHLERHGREINSWHDLRIELAAWAVALCIFAALTAIFHHLFF